ncbi:ATP-binding protein [Streptomyces sp. NPDC021093]|uniref:ATP-binding protein n=1 Tax=Streptomyces sp. NPDC021093 TaxID=3365112 RepID=UPI0037B85C5A
MPDTAQKYFDAKPESVRQAREFATDTLTSWGLVGPLEDVRLCVSELASNALVHGTRLDHGFLVRLSTDEDDEDFVRLEVHDSRNPDDQAHRPTVCHASSTDTAGRGLHIVELLADCWGVEEREPYGKVVWSRFKAVPEIRSV